LEEIEMKHLIRNKLIKTVFIVALLAALLGAFTACEDMGYPSSTTTTEEEPEAEKATSPTVISTKDAALMAVYQQLLGLAESYEAKIYLADFYATCDNWTATSEIFKDGSGTWHIQVDMTNQETWQYRPYWQQAGWFVFKDGKVIPSNYFQANALRIEADLQALSSKLEQEPAEESESES
jgi:hypothetical protein